MKIEYKSSKTSKNAFFASFSAFTLDNLSTIQYRLSHINALRINQSYPWTLKICEDFWELPVLRISIFFESAMLKKNISILFFFLLYSQENQFFWVKLNIYNFTLTVRTLFDDQRFLQVLFNFRGFEPQPRRYILFLNLILNVFFSYILIH